jgi:hypothetical protein
MSLPKAIPTREVNGFSFLFGIDSLSTRKDCPILSAKKGMKNTGPKMALIEFHASSDF